MGTNAHVHDYLAQSGVTLLTGLVLTISHIAKCLNNSHVPKTTGLLLAPTVAKVLNI